MDEITAKPPMLLTIILAVKDVPEVQINAFVWPLLSLRNSGRIQLLIVSSGKAPDIDDRWRKGLASIRVVESPPLGVYHAYNRGLEEPLAEYVLFMGSDDLVLPALDRVLDSVLSAEVRPDLIACCSLMQDVGLSCPSRIRGALIFRNWCHQALLYHKRLFFDRHFDVKYPVQADHKFNLELLANRKLRVDYRRDVITHFASGGLTSQLSDLKFRADMPDIVRSSYGNIYWALSLIKRKVADIVKGPPESRCSPKGGRNP